MHRRRAFTLIEVVAALALLSTTLVFLLAAQQRGLQRLAESREQETAAQMARELIAEWRLQSKGFRAGGDGIFPVASAWRWTRTEEPFGHTEGTRLRQVTLAVFHEQEPRLPNPTPVVSYVWLEEITER